LKVEIIDLRLKSKPIVLTRQGLESGLNHLAKRFVLDKTLSKTTSVTHRDARLTFPAAELHQQLTDSKLEMSQLWGLQRNGPRRVGHHECTDLSRFWVKGHGKWVNFRGHIVDWH